MAENAKIPPAVRVKVDGKPLDAVISVEHVADAEATEHPVEQGADPTDHVRQKPDVVRLDAFVSNSPLDAEITDAFSDLAPGRAAYEFLRSIKEAGKLVTVTTKERVYENMLLLTLSVPRDSRTGDGLRFSAQFKQIRVVQNLTVEIPSTDIRGRGKTKLGKQQTTPTPDATKNKSIAKQAYDSKTGQKFKNKGAELFEAIGRLVK